MSAHPIFEIRCDGPGDTPCPEGSARTGDGSPTEIRRNLAVFELWINPARDVDRCEACAKRAVTRG